VFNLQVVLASEMLLWINLVRPTNSMAWE